MQDPLKPLEKICDPDERQKASFGTLEELHSALADIEVCEGAPLDVRQLFETAKNLSLYSWFVYRFHQVAELVSFAALEMALRERYLAEYPPEVSSKKRSPTLYRLMLHAKKNKWISNQGFPSLYERARCLAENRKVHEVLQNKRFDTEGSIHVPEPSDDEIHAALVEMDLVSAIANNAHKIRNELAHGSSALHPDSVSTLRTCAEVINQVFS